jgi:hypothetical protein
MNDTTASRTPAIFIPADFIIVMAGMKVANLIVGSESGWDQSGDEIA